MRPVYAAYRLKIEPVMLCDLGVAAPGRPWRGSPLCPLGGKPGLPALVARSGGHPVWANTEQAAQHLVKLSIQRAAQPRVFRTVRARERSARSCQWFPSLLSKVMVQAGIAAHCAFTVLLANAGTTAEFSSLDGKGVDFKSDPLARWPPVLGCLQTGDGCAGPWSSASTVEIPVLFRNPLTSAVTS